MASGDGSGPCDDLSILCVTKAEWCVESLLYKLARNARDLDAELVLSCDGHDAVSRLSAMRFPGWTGSSECGPQYTLHSVSSRGYVESVLDQAIAATSRSYVLRIDDDEALPHAMLMWLRRGAYRAADNWSFPRQHLWECPSGRIGCLMTPHLFPDRQTRLSVREKAGGRYGVHQGSVHGEGEIASVSIVHHKFVIRTREDRRRIAQTYDAYSPGYGTGNMLPFSLPEEAYDEMRVVEAGDGSVPWTPKWETVVDNRDHGF